MNSSKRNGRKASKILTEIRGKDSAYWELVRQKNALTLFQKAARSVPAYKHFLAHHNVVPAKIKSFADFQHVPPVSKENYLRKYPVEKSKGRWTKYTEL